jgi:hypothetical protein
VLTRAIIIACLVMLASCQQLRCKLKPGVDVSIESTNTKQLPNVKPKAEVNCAF